MKSHRLNCAFMTAGSGVASESGFFVAMQYHFDLEGFEGRELAVEVANAFSAPRLLMDGQPAPPGLKRLEYLLRRNDGTTVTARLQPAQMGSMIEVAVGDQVVSVMEPLQWYEWAWIGLPFL